MMLICTYAPCGDTNSLMYHANISAKHTDIVKTTLNSREIPIDFVLDVTLFVDRDGSQPLQHLSQGEV